MAAPALAASIAESAICLGERGTCGLRSCEPPEPVTAQVMKTSRFISSGIFLSLFDQEAIIAPLAAKCFAIYERHMAKNEKPTIFRAERSALKVTLLVFSGSSIMCVASAVDPLRAANRIAGET